MEVKNEGWESFAARVYYVAAGAYYLKELAAGTGILSLIVSAVTISRSLFFVGVLTAIGGAVSVGMAVSFWVLSVRKRLSGPNSSLRILTIEEIYEVLGDGRYISKRTARVKALRDGTDSYKDKFLWTGTGGIAPTVLAPAGSRIQIEREHLGPRQVSRVAFERPLRRGEQLELAYALDLNDEERTFQPFLRVTVNDWIQKTLTLRVIFRTGLPARIRRRIFLPGASDIPIYEKRVQADPATREVVWLVRRPRPQFRYQIDWRSKDGE